MKNKDSRYYLVKEEILPSAVRKTIKALELLHQFDNLTINEAVAQAGLSRSAYYKYKDSVLPFYQASLNKIISISTMLENKKGVLSNVLNTVSTDGGNILTINQSIPLRGVAMVTISIETKNITIDLEAILDKIRLIDGVRRLEVIGQV